MMIRRFVAWLHSFHARRQAAVAVIEREPRPGAMPIRRELRSERDHVQVGKQEWDQRRALWARRTRGSPENSPRIIGEKK